MHLKPLESRVLAVLLALLVLAVGYFGLVHWWFVAPQLRINVEMQSLRDTENRYAAIIAQRQTLQKRLQALSHDQAESSLLLVGDDAGATAALMQRVVDVITTHATDDNCKVVQKMPLPTTDNGNPYRKVGVNISLRCNMRVLGSVLHDLEYGAPYLFIDNLSIYRNPVPTQDGGMRPLDVTFDVSGYARQVSGAVQP